MIQAWIHTALLAALPISEIRGALPAVVLLGEIPWWGAYISAVIGNSFVVIPLFFGLMALRHTLMRVFPRAGIAMDWWIEKSRTKLHANYEKYGWLALYVFTAIPFPLTGVYTATAAAVAMRIPFYKTFPSLLAGVMTSGVIVLILIKIGSGI